MPAVGMSFTSPAYHVEDAHTTSGDSSVPVEEVEGSIESVEPSFGSPAGGETVFVNGTGFEKGVDVFFDSWASPDVFYVNSKKLRVVTPAHALGFADVAVRWPGGKVRLLPKGFLYKTDLAVTAVEPATGPIEGGTPVTITGKGFLKDCGLLFGSRLALQVQLVDDQTIFAVTPPGDSAGPADVHVVGAAGTVSLKDAFVYSVAPMLSAIVPAAGPAAGGQKAELSGKWLGPVTSVLFGEQQAAILSQQNNRLVVTVPPGEAGTVDVAVVGTWGWDALTGGYLYYDPAAMQGKKIAVVPASGPDSGGNVASIVGCGMTEDGPVAVDFGGAAAQIVGQYPEQCAITVTIPAGTGLVDVAVQGASDQFVAKKGYTYLPDLSVTAVAPNVGSFKGGTKIEIAGKHFSAGLQVLVGPMAAGEVVLVSEEKLTAVTPPGSPGLVDVTVVAGAGTARLSNAFLYTVDSPEVWLVTPSYGSRAGGTYVEIIGAGFDQDADLLFADDLATGVKVKSYCRLTGYTPPEAVGTYDVTISDGNGTAVLPAAYSYFDPTSWYGGTWGPSIDGAVNVTIFDAAIWGPLEGAVVVLGADPNTPYKGVTDANGHVTLSGPGLVGPVDVHATKPEYDAASFIHVDAENSTLYLIPFNPPSTGPVEPVEPIPDGAVGGRVTGLGKYVIIPPGDCKNKKPDPGALCSPCIEQSDCLDGYACLAMGKTGKYCSTACVLAKADKGEEGEAEDPCPDGYMCAPVQTQGTHCTPAMGYRSARCEISRTSIYDFPYGQEPYVVVDPLSMYQLESRPGEVAVVCLGGYVDYDTEEFHPLAMGVKRHVNVKPATLAQDQNIWLNIPLTRKLRLRMEDPPKFANYNGVYRVTAYLEFGSDGIFELPGAFEGFEQEDVMLETLPAELTGDLYDATYIIRAGAYTNSQDLIPYSVLLLHEIADVSETSVAGLEQSQFVSVPVAPKDEELNAAWTGPLGTFLAGAEGRMFVLKNGHFSQLPTVVDDELNDIFGFLNGKAVAVGDNGVVLFFDGQKWALVGQATDMPLRSVWGDSPDDLYAVGPYRIVSYYEGQWSETKVAFDLTSVWGDGPDQIWAVGRGGALLSGDGTGWVPDVSPTDKDLHAVRVWPDGSLLVAGDGIALRRNGGDWTDLGLDPQFQARSVNGTGSGDFFLTGEAGVVAHYVEGVGFNYLAVPDNLMANDLYFDGDGRPTVVGTTAMLLKPFVPFPIFLNPVNGGTMQPLFLDWYYEGETDMITLHTVDITQRTGAPIWRLVIDGSRTSVKLPDFGLLIGLEPVPGPDVEKRLRINSVHMPEFSINSFDYMDFGTLSWTAWAYDMIAWDIEPEE
jgi:hypothetical protein